MIHIKKNLKAYFNITLASVAMLGVVVLQIVWFTNAYHLKNELFDYKVNVALKSIVNQMKDKKHEMNKDVFCEHFCKYQNQNIIEHIDKNLLDSIIDTEFESLDIDRYYEYAVIKKSNNEFIIGKYDKYKEQLISTKYSISLSCVSTCSSPEDSFFIAFVFPQKELYIFKQLLISLIAALLLFILLVISYFKTASYYLRLLRLSAIKADFINNLTHEFKTPIATISLAGDMLKNENVVSDKEKRIKYLSIIKTENERLKNHVNQILQISNMEKGDVVLNLTNTDIHALIERLLSNFEIIIKEKEGQFSKDLKAEKYLSMIDETHFYNVLSNLIDNSLKYNNNKPLVNIESYNSDGKLFIIITDNGIGISKEHINHVFKQFYRVPTGNVHNIKGFGLGLYYVKTILTAMKADIKIKSELQKGTIFTIIIPV